MRMQLHDAAIVYISGQSNAHAHGQMLPESEIITAGLKNVFALDRKPNQSFENIPAVWSNFTSRGKNLGETQDDTASFAYYLAKRWQAAIDGGLELPDLYVVQISVGAQGLLGGMWSKSLYAEKRLVPGELGSVDISLYPLAERVYKAVYADLSCRFRNPLALGWHWIGSEQDHIEYPVQSAEPAARYDDFFDTMLKAIGFPCPVFFYKLLFTSDNSSPRGRDALNGEFLRQAKRLGNAYIVEADRSPLWNPNDDGLGIFAPDRVHYLAQTNKWFADSFFERCIAEYG